MRRSFEFPADAETQAGIANRLAKAGYREPDTYVLEHGYCRSLYVTDPNGMIVEFTCDSASAVGADTVRDRREKARRELSRWLAGDHTSNNVFR